MKHNEFSTVVTWISSEYGMKIKQTKNYEKSERWKKNPETNNMMKSFFTVHNVTWREKLHCLYEKSEHWKKKKKSRNKQYDKKLFYSTQCHLTRNITLSILWPLKIISEKKSLKLFKL